MLVFKLQLSYCGRLGSATKQYSTEPLSSETALQCCVARCTCGQGFWGWLSSVGLQVGCPMRCSFCATGKGGFARNLKAHEIMDQVMTVQEEFGSRVSNIGKGPHQHTCFLLVHSKAGIAPCCSACWCRGKVSAAWMWLHSVVMPAPVGCRMEVRHCLSANDCCTCSTGTVMWHSQNNTSANLHVASEAGHLELSCLMQFT